MNKRLVIDEKEFLSWKKKTQKVLKQDGYYLQYSKEGFNFALYPGLEKTKRSIHFNIHFGFDYQVSASAKILIDLRDSTYVGLEKSFGGINLFVREAIGFFSERDIFKHLIEIKSNSISPSFHSDNDELIPGLKEASNASYLDNRKKVLVDRKSFQLIEPLMELSKESYTFYNSLVEKEDNTLRRFNRDIGANFKTLKLIFEDIIDKTVKIMLKEDLEEYLVEFHSSVHTKVITMKEVNLDRIQEELINFNNEEKLSSLFKGPQMNQVIEKYLKNIASCNSLGLEVEEIFNFLSEHDLTVEEMTEQSEVTYTSPEIRKNTITQRDKSHDEEDNNYKSRSLTVVIYKCYGMYLFVGNLTEKKNYERVVTNDLFLFTSFENALEKEKEWISQNL